MTQVHFTSRTLRGRVIKAGCARGAALTTTEPLSFLGGVDPETGLVIEPRHPLYGQSIAGRVLVFPHGKGSTVGSYTLYRLVRNGVAPAGIVCRSSEPIVAVGAIISNIPMLDCIPIEEIHDGDAIIIRDECLTIHPGGFASCMNSST